MDLKEKQIRYIYSPNRLNLVSCSPENVLGSASKVLVEFELHPVTLVGTST